MTSPIAVGRGGSILPDTTDAIRINPHQVTTVGDVEFGQFDFSSIVRKAFRRRSLYYVASREAR